jgi:hypothetical protein
MKYTYPDFLLLFDGVLALIAAAYSLAYLIHWRNGKSVTSFFSFFLFGYLGLIHLLAFLNILDRATYGATYVRPFLPLVYGMIIAHVYIDWQKNKINRAEFERRLFEKLQKKKGKRV